MYARQITTEEINTLAEVKRIIKMERIQKRNMLLGKAKQKISGIALIAVSVIAPIILNGDATIDLLILPLGVYLTFTKERII